MGIEVVHITADGKEIDGTTDISKTPSVKTNPKEVLDLFNKDTPMFAEFYANWCGHCKTLAPEWKKLIKLIEESNYKDKNIAIVSVESAVINKDIDNVLKQIKLTVNGFPTIGLIKDKKFISYEGKRDASSMLKFIKEKAWSIMGGGGRSTRKRTKHKRSSTKHKRSSTKRSSTKRSSTKHKSKKTQRRRKY